MGRVSSEHNASTKLAGNMKTMRVAEPLSRRNRLLLREMVKTDFKLRYQGSFLGHLWSILKPLALFAVMYVVFVRFLRFGAGIPHFAVSLLLAMTMWTFFGEAVSQGMNSIVARGDLLRKISFPKIIIVLSATVGALINFAINLVVVLVFAIINGVQFHWYILLAPLVFIELYLFALGLALLLSALFVRFRDVGHLWDIVMQGWFYATPIIYPLSMVYAPGGESTVTRMTMAKVLLMSPIAQMIQDMRTLIVLPTDTVWVFIQNPFVKAVPLAIVVAVLILGIYTFNKRSKAFAEEI